MSLPAVAALFIASSLDYVRPVPAPVPSDGALTTHPVLLWSRTLPGTPPATATRTEPAPAVVDGDRIYVGYSGANALLILDRHDGTLVGSVPANGPVVSAAVIAGDFLYFSDSAGYTFAYRRDALDGSTPAWTHFSGAPILSSPTLAGGTLYLANVDDLAFALDARTGELRWRHGHKVDATRASELELFGAPPVVADPARAEVLVGFSDGFLVALGAADGSQRWSAEVGEGAYPDLIAPPLVGPQGVWVGGYSEPLVSLAPDGRAVQWRLPVGSASPFSSDGEALFHPGTDGKLRRIDARTGEVLWIWDSVTDGTLGAPQLTPAGLLVTSTEASAYLVDPATGKLLWTFDPGPLLHGVSARPAIAGRDVYVVSNAGVLYALHASDAAPPTDRLDWVSPASRR